MRTCPLERLRQSGQNQAKDWTARTEPKSKPVDMPRIKDLPMLGGAFPGDGVCAPKRTNGLERYSAMLGNRSESPMTRKN